MVVVIGCGIKVTDIVCVPPKADVTVIDEEGTVVANMSVPVASKVPNGWVGRLVLAESMGLNEASLEVAWMARTPLASS